MKKKRRKGKLLNNRIWKHWLIIQQKEGHEEVILKDDRKGGKKDRETRSMNAMGKFANDCREMWNERGRPPNEWQGRRRRIKDDKTKNKRLMNTNRFHYLRRQRETRSDLVAIQFGEFAQDGQGEDEPLAQSRLASGLRNIHQTIGGAHPVAVDVRHPVLGGCWRGVGRQDNFRVILEKIDLTETTSKIRWVQLSWRAREVKERAGNRLANVVKAPRPTWSVLLSNCMMMALGVRTQRFMWTKGRRRWTGEVWSCWLSPPSVKFSSMYWAK